VHFRATDAGRFHHFAARKPINQPSDLIIVHRSSDASEPVYANDYVLLSHVLRY
jgi:hypothetical protein